MSEETRPGAGAVFINYRTEDTGESPSALARELCNFFGPDEIFIWEQGSPEFSDRIRATEIQLQRLRISYEPVRVRVRVTAEIFSGFTYPEAEKVFIRKVLAYFPSGEMRFEDTVGRNSTSATALLEHLLSSPDGPGSQELHGAVKSTLRLHWDRWAEVCDAYARLQVFWGVTP